MSLKFLSLKASFLPVKKALAVFMVLQLLIGAPISALAQEGERNADRDTRSPIKHVIVIIGENRTFDHIFGTFKPRRGQTISTCSPRALSTATERLGLTFPSLPSSQQP
jgi:phospholipase C